MPSGRWAARVRNPATRRQMWLGTFDSEEEARLAEAQAKLDMRLVRGGDETCDSFAARWMDDYRSHRGESTRLHNRQLIAAFARDFKGRKLRDVSGAEARLWADGGDAAPHLQEIASRWHGVEVRGRSVRVPRHRGHAKVARAMFTDAVSDGLADRNPFSNMNLGDGPGRKHVLPLRSEEVFKLAEIAEQVHGADGSGTRDGDFGRLMYGPMVLVAAYSGMRPGELYALRWEDVRFGDEEIDVQRQLSSRLGRETATKNKRARRIYLADPAARAFERIRDGNLYEGDPIFRIRNGKPFAQRMSHYYWNPVRERFAGWLAESNPRRHRDLLVEEGAERDMDFYELRHFCASIMLDHGDRPEEVAHQLGHTDGGRLVQTLYGHLYVDDALQRIKDRRKGGKRRRVG